MIRIEIVCLKNDLMQRERKSWKDETADPAHPFHRLQLYDKACAAKLLQDPYFIFGIFTSSHNFDCEIFAVFGSSKHSTGRSASDFIHQKKKNFFFACVHLFTLRYEFVLVTSASLSECV